MADHHMELFGSGLVPLLQHGFQHYEGAQLAAYSFFEELLTLRLALQVQTCQEQILKE